MTPSHPDDDFDWCSFFALFWNDKGLKLKLNVPDTVIFRYGQLCAWWSTNKESCVQRQPRSKCTLAMIQKKFLENQSKCGYKYSAIFRKGAERPVLLSLEEFQTLMKEIESSKDSETGVYTWFLGIQNVVLQAFVEVYGHICTQIMAIVRMNVFFVEYTSTKTDNLPVMDLRYVTTYINTGHTMTCHTFQRPFSLRYMSTEIRDTTDIEEADAQAQSKQFPVDPVIKMQFRTVVQQIVKYVQKTHGFTLSGLICEMVRDPNGKILLLSVVRTEWASNSWGNGSGSLYADSLLKEPEEMRESVLDDSTESYSLFTSRTEHPNKYGIEFMVPSSPNHQSQYPGGRITPSNAASGFNVVNSWPSIHHEDLSIWRSHSMSARTGPRDYPKPWRPNSACGSRRHERVSFSTQPRTVTERAASLRSTIRPNEREARSRTRPVIVSQLTREVETLRDEVLLQYELAEASAAKVRSLEKEKEIAAVSFQHNVEDLESRLAETSVELTETQHAKELVNQKLREAEMKVEQLEKERQRLRDAIDGERSTTIISLKEYQTRDVTLNEQVKKLQADAEELKIALREEKAANNALKKQLVEHADQQKLTDAWGSAGGLAPVLEMVHNLLDTQDSPHGEQYALVKVLQTHHELLRATFLFYCQQDTSVMDHWPPCMTLKAWKLFCHDTEVSDSRAGARIRSASFSRMVSVSEMEKTFHRYSQVDYDTMHEQHPVLSYEAFLAALVHCGENLKKEDMPFLSENVRAFIVHYVNRARRVSPTSFHRTRSKKYVKKKRVLTRKVTSKYLRWS